MPCSLKYLNLCGYEFEIYSILEHKHKLQNLQKLNVGTEDMSIQVIRQELHELDYDTCDIEVFYDQEESRTSLLSYSTLNPPSDTFQNVQALQEVNDILDLLENQPDMNKYA